MRNYQKLKIYSIHTPSDPRVYVSMTTQTYLSTLFNSHKRKGILPPKAYSKLELAISCDSVEAAKDLLRTVKNKYGDLCIDSLSDYTKSVNADTQKSAV